jgi:predicted nucleic acid-binding protein
MGLVIDTSALVTLEKERVAGDRLPFRDENLVLPAIVWAEALIGVYLADTPERAALRRGLLERIRRATALELFHAEVAEHYGRLYATLRKKGILLPQNDLQVAAHALFLDYGVLVGRSDEQHFRKIPGLRIEYL